MKLMPAPMSRKMAKQLSMKRFYTGIECRNGHICERITSNNGCVLCQYASALRWREQNREAYNAYHRVYQAKYRLDKSK